MGDVVVGDGRLRGAGLPCTVTQPAFAHTNRAVAGGAHRPRRRPDIDNLPPPALLHTPDDRLRTDQRARQVRLQHFTPPRKACRIKRRAEGTDTGVVDEDIDRTKYPDYLLEGGMHALWMRDICCGRESLPARVTNLSCH